MKHDNTATYLIEALTLLIRLKNTGTVVTSQDTQDAEDLLEKIRKEFENKKQDKGKGQDNKDYSAELAEAMNDWAKGGTVSLQTVEVLRKSLGSMRIVSPSGGEGGNNGRVRGILRDAVIVDDMPTTISPRPLPAYPQPSDTQIPEPLKSEPVPSQKGVWCSICRVFHHPDGTDVPADHL